MNIQENVRLSVKYIIIVVAIFLFVKEVNSQSISSVPNSFSISGTIPGVNKGTIMLGYMSSQKEMWDSARIEMGHFNFKGSVPSPTPAQMYIKGSPHRFSSQNISFYLENSPITVWVNKDSMDVSKVSGSHSNDDKDSITALLAPYYETLRSLRKVQGFASKQHLTSVLKNLDDIYDELPGAQRKLIVDYALVHPDSYAITSMLSMNFTNNQSDLPLLKKVYDHFSDAVKKSVGGQDISGLIKRIERVQIGNTAPEFTMPDQNGKMVKLSSFKGKYVLLDFWASWCVPCRAESPNLVKAYEKYKDKKFTIVGISLDVEKDKQKWLDAIKKDGLHWTQLSSLKGYEEEGVRQLYSVQGIPDNFLINPDGKIIARGLRGKELKEKLATVIK